jgi:hypothetical protein
MQGSLMLTCPVTGDEYSTGINTDELSLDMLPDTLTRSHCPHCGQMHPWRLSDATFVQNLRPSKWIENVAQAARVRLSYRAGRRFPAHIRGLRRPTSAG